MILIENEIEGIPVSIEIHENAENNTLDDAPFLKTDVDFSVIMPVDLLIVVKAIVNSETVEEFIRNVGDTWGKERLAIPIIKQLNSYSIKDVQGEAVKELGKLLGDEEKDLFGYDENHDDCLYGCFIHYSMDYGGRFDKLSDEDKINYLIDSALDEC